MADIRRIMFMGFIFGILFGVLAYISNFDIDYSLIWTIPFLVAALCGLGTIIAFFVSNTLIAKGYYNGTIISVISFIVAALINSLIVLIILTYFGIADLHPQTLLVGILGLIMGGIYGIYRYRMGIISEKMKFLEELADTNRQLQEASRKLAITEERNRMGRELHDSVSQGLHGLVFAIHSLHNELQEPTQRVSEILTHMEATANSNLDELHTMIEELRPSLLAEEGLEEALRVTVSLFSQSQKVPVDIEIQLPDMLPPGLEMTIYRITQEALANIKKHASSKHVYFKISNDGNLLYLTIRDNGKGFNNKNILPGNGLRNMRQRTEERDGSLNIVSKPGIGTSVIAKFPLNTTSAF